MNIQKHMWVALIAATLAPLVNAADLDREIRKEADALVARLNAPSPQEQLLMHLGELCDRRDKEKANADKSAKTTFKQDKYKDPYEGDSKSPRSPKLNAANQALKRAVSPLILCSISPMSPKPLTRQLSSPRLKPTAHNARS